MGSETERIADWLIAGLELESTLFHVGEYCDGWQASTAGHQRASFHVVLGGETWLHLPARAERPARSLRLVQGDAVFLLHDMPHCLSSSPLPPVPGQSRQGRMRALSPSLPDGTPGVALACGFFSLRAGPGGALLALLPDHVRVPRDGSRAIFDLIRAEAHQGGERPSPLITRLTELLFLYALRALVQRAELAPGLVNLMRRAEFAPLIAALVDEPGRRWTTETMADFVHMSRARFCKAFTEACGQPPAQFLALIRMKTAAALLRAGASTPDAAEQVGYQSESAFAQAFKRITGQQPGAYRRLRTDGPASHAALH